MLHIQVKKTKFAGQVHFPFYFNLKFRCNSEEIFLPETMKVKPVEPLTLAPAVSTQLPSATSPSDGLASPQHPSVLLQEKAEPWKGPGEVERLYGARADFAGTLHAQHKKAADILL